MFRVRTHSHQSSSDMQARWLRAEHDNHDIVAILRGSTTRKERARIEADLSDDSSASCSACVRHCFHLFLVWRTLIPSHERATRQKISLSLPLSLSLSRSLALSLSVSRLDEKTKIISQWPCVYRLRVVLLSSQLAVGLNLHGASFFGHVRPVVEPGQQRAGRGPHPPVWVAPQRRLHAPIVCRRPPETGTSVETKTLFLFTHTIGRRASATTSTS